MSRAYRVISPNIHEYISYITWIPKYAKDVITRDPAFFVHKTKNGDRGGGPRKGESLCKERKRVAYIYIYIYIFAYHEENMPRNAPRALKQGWPERGEPTTRGEEEGKEEAEADARVQKKKQLHPVHPTILSLFLSISLFFPTALLTLAFRFYAFISLSRLRIFLPPLFATRKRYALRNISIRVHWERGEIFLSLERLRETLNFECACCEIVRGKF